MMAARALNMTAERVVSVNLTKEESLEKGLVAYRSTLLEHKANADLQEEEIALLLRQQFKNCQHLFTNDLN